MNYSRTKYSKNANPSEHLAQQRVKSKEEQVKSNEQQAKSNKQRTKINEQ